MDRTSYDLMTKLFRVSEGELYSRLDDVVGRIVEDLNALKERMVQSQVGYEESLAQLDKVLVEIKKLKELSWQEWNREKQF